MTQEEKELLLKDLCARLPYEVIVGTTDNDGSLPNFWTLDSYKCLNEDVIITNCEYNADRLTYFCDVRPYLFPLSSMTEEQKKEFIFLHSDKQKEAGHSNLEIIIEPCKLKIDWLNKNHFDYRGLIPMDLAIDATGLNIY